MSYKNYRDYEKDFKNNIQPRCAIIELTHRCNFNCVHCCNAAEEKPELSLDEIKQLVGDLVASGFLIISLTGGEPFLRDDLFEIADYIKSKNLALSIFTNGSLIKDSHIDKLESLNLLKLAIPLYGASRGTYKKTTGTPDGYDMVTNTLLKLKDRDIRVIIGGQILKTNFNDFREVRFLSQRFSKHPPRLNCHVFPAHDRSRIPLNYGLTQEQLGYVMKHDMPLLVAPHQKGFGNFPCGIGVHIIGIGPYGDIYPCPNFRLSVGNIRNESFEKVWYDSNKLNNLRKSLYEEFKECWDCKIQKICSCCPALSFLKYGEEGKPFKREACKDALLRKKALQCHGKDVLKIEDTKKESNHYGKEKKIEFKA